MGALGCKTNSVKLSKSSYRALNGNGDVIGDGLVPRDSALLIGSKQVVMKETAHGKAFGKDWYGSKNKVEEWLNKSSEWNGNNSE